MTMLLTASYRLCLRMPQDKRQALHTRHTQRATEPLEAAAAAAKRTGEWIYSLCYNLDVIFCWYILIE